MTDSNPKLKLAVLGSGTGSNCQAIIDAIAAGELDAEIVCVLSDVDGAYILDRAADHGIPSEFLSAAPFKTKLEGDAEAAYIATIRESGADLILLAGFMRVIKKGLIDAFPGRIINIHPSLLPAFPGVEGWKQTLAYGCKVGGCTVHIVNEGVDTGPIIVQKAVPEKLDYSARDMLRPWR